MYKQIPYMPSRKQLLVYSSLEASKPDLCNVLQAGCLSGDKEAMTGGTCLICLQLVSLTRFACKCTRLHTTWPQFDTGTYYFNLT